MDEIKRDISPVQRQIKENLKIYKMQQEMSFEQGLNSNRNKDEQKISLFEQMRNQKLEENKLLLGNKLNDNRQIKKEKSKIDEDFSILKHLDDIQEQRNNINSKLYLQQEQKQTGKYSLTNSSKSSLQNDEQNQPKDLNFKKKKINNFFNYHEVHGSQNNEGQQKENQQSDINIEESNKENRQLGNQQIMKNQNNQIQEKQERKNIWQNSEEIISKIKQREKQNNGDNKNDFIYNTNEKQQKLSRQNSKKDYSRGRKALNIVMSVDKLRKNVDTVEQKREIQENKSQFEVELIKIQQKRKYEKEIGFLKEQIQDYQRKEIDYKVQIQRIQNQLNQVLDQQNKAKKQQNNQKQYQNNAENYKSQSDKKLSQNLQNQQEIQELKQKYNQSFSFIQYQNPLDAFSQSTQDPYLQSQKGNFNQFYLKEENIVLSQENDIVRKENQELKDLNEDLIQQNQLLLKTIQNWKSKFQELGNSQSSY